MKKSLQDAAQNLQSVPDLEAGKVDIPDHGENRILEGRPIKQVASRDAGRYTCVARNALGSCSTCASVNLQGF